MVYRPVLDAAKREGGRGERRETTIALVVGKVRYLLEWYDCSSSLSLSLFSCLLALYPAICITLSRMPKTPSLGKKESLPLSLRPCVRPFGLLLLPGLHPCSKNALHCPHSQAISPLPQHRAITARAPLLRRRRVATASYPSITPLQRLLLPPVPLEHHNPIPNLDPLPLLPILPPIAPLRRPLRLHHRRHLRNLTPPTNRS